MPLLLLITFIALAEPVAWGDTLFLGGKDAATSERVPTNAMEHTKELWQHGLISPIDVPRVEIYDDAGNAVLLKDFKGEVVVVVFWASWCLQCVEELMTLEKLTKDLNYNEVKNVRILPISIDFKPQEVQAEILKNNDIINLPYYNDKNKELMNHLDVHSLPTSFVIDATSKIVFKVQQHLNWNDPTIYNELIKLADTQNKP